MNVNNGYVHSEYKNAFAVSSAPIIGDILEISFKVIKAHNKTTILHIGVKMTGYW